MSWTSAIQRVFVPYLVVLLLSLNRPLPEQVDLRGAIVRSDFTGKVVKIEKMDRNEDWIWIKPMGKQAMLLMVDPDVVVYRQVGRGYVGVTHDAIQIGQELYAMKNDYVAVFLDFVDFEYAIPKEIIIVQ